MMDIFIAKLAWLFVNVQYTGSFLLDRTRENLDEVITGISSGGADAVIALFPLTILVLQAFSLFTTLKVLNMVWTLLHEAHLPWNRFKSFTAVRGGAKRILVVGDSTAYGLGATRPEDTIAGRLGRDFPNTDIINTAINGSRTKDVIRQLRNAGNQKFDLIIISTGGNDIWHFTRLKRLERDLAALLTEAINKSAHRVILLFYPNFGSAAVFPSALRNIMSRRTIQIHGVFEHVSRAFDVPLVELYTHKTTHRLGPNPFEEDPNKYYAKDKMHPNSEGYRLWYNDMWREMVARSMTFKE